MTRKRRSSIPRYSAFPAGWRGLVERGQPFVVTNAARSRLSMDVVARVGATTDIVLKDQVSGAVGQATLGELVTCLGQEGAIWYMAQHAVPACLDPLIPRRPIARIAGLRKPNIWLGSAGAFTQLHQDVLHNLVVQLDGRKQFTIFAPEDEPYLYRRTSSERANYSQIENTSAVDRKQFPDYRKATPYRIELGPKDILVMPAYWWHEVLTLEASLMLNYWWAPTLASVRGIAVERQIFSSTIARLHVLKHLDLSSLPSDHALVDLLCRQKLALLAAIVLGDMTEEFVGALAAKHGLGTLYPATCQALLETSGKLPGDAADALTQIRDEARTAAAAIEAKGTAPSLRTGKLNQRLRELCAAQRVPRCRRFLENNKVWMKDIVANSYLF